jgi:hypothetical protein
MSTPSKGPRTDAQSALNALIRARKRAEEVAAATGTAIIQWENGRIVRIYPGRRDDGSGSPEPASK